MEKMVLDYGCIFSSSQEIHDGVVDFFNKMLSVSRVDVNFDVSATSR